MTLIERLSKLAGEHGVGRVDHIENRLVGIKSREVYEAPAGVVLYQAHRQLEKMVLSKEQARFKETVASEYASLVYNGQWFTSLHQDLAAFITSSQRHVTGAVRARLHKGTCRVVGRSAPDALYSHQLATYDTGDQFDHSAAEGLHRPLGPADPARKPSASSSTAPPSAPASPAAPPSSSRQPALHLATGHFGQLPGLPMVERAVSPRSPAHLFGPAPISASILCASLSCGVLRASSQTIW